MTEAKRIIDEAIEKYNPTNIFCLFSGGNDSQVVTHAVMETYKHLNPEVVHIDTGIGIPETQQFVIDTCEKYNWPLKIYRASENTKADGTPDPMIYDDIVIANGFPGPGAHRIMYSKLKQRQVRRLVRENKKSWKDRILLISGVRQQESKRRMGTTEECFRDGAQVWVAPMLYMSSTDQANYMTENNLTVNPVKAKLCMSGECLCGAFAHKGELKEIKFWYPEVAERIERLQEKVKAAGHSGSWEKSKWKAKAKVSKAGPLCTTCDARYDAAVSA
jgi:3'-phosphoadenosine 5'-phosphosulfate sulfotransferase (PAPS reductase)/FAD synthetase